MFKKQIKYQELLDIVKSMKYDEELFFFFLRACENKNLKICQLCLDAGIDINIKSGRYNQTLFQQYVEGGKFTPEVADWLIEHGADMNYSHVFKALTCACYSGNYEMFKYFIDKGLKIRQCKDSRNDRSDLYWAVHGGNYKIVKTLIDFGLDFEDDSEAFINAVIDKKYKIVELFLQNGTNIEYYYYDFTPLHYAVCHNDIILAELLLNYNANVNAEINQSGRHCRLFDEYYAITPMDIALIKNNLDMQDLLLKYNGRATSKEEKIQALLEAPNNKPEYTKVLKKILQNN